MLTEAADKLNKVAQQGDCDHRVEAQFLVNLTNRRILLQPAYLARRTCALRFRLTMLFEELVEQTSACIASLAAIRTRADCLPTKCQIKGAGPYISNCLRDLH